MEHLNRGVVAIATSNGNFISWRLLGNDDQNVKFNIYKNGSLLLNTEPIDGATNFVDADGTVSDTYSVQTLLNGNVLEESIAVTPWSKNYLKIQLDRPAGGTSPDGEIYAYRPNDCSVADLDGDGEYEIIVKWDPTNQHDNSESGYTGNVYLDAYKLNGTKLWRIDLGINIRAGAHYTQFMVYDYDGDGIAELVCKTAPGTIDGEGKNVLLEGDSADADYRNHTANTSGTDRKGFILKGPEYLTLFDGLTGKELHTVPYNPPRHPSKQDPTPSELNTVWGDNYGNRVDRFLACVAYLDGVHPSVVMCRGYYTRATLAAYDVVNKKLVQRWFHDSSTKGAGAYGQGNHNLSVADVDSDGKDEIIYGACAFDDDGTLIYRTGFGHGDAMHVSDIDPDSPGLEVWEVHEEKTSAYGYELHNASTGTVLWGTSTGTDNGRGLAADIDANSRGFEMWSSSGSGIYSCKGEQLSTSKPSTNFRIYWDGDLQDELLDGVKLDKWNGNGTNRLITFSDYENAASNNGTKATPSISADILGDWREEVVLYSANDSSSLLVFSTTIPTEHRLYTPMHDPVYRLGVAWQNTAYNQPPHLGFYIGDGLSNIPVPNIFTPIYDPNNSTIDNDKAEVNHTSISVDDSGYLYVTSTKNIESVKIYNLSGILLDKNLNINNSYFKKKLQKTNSIKLISVNSAGKKEVFKVLY
ncbi:MAG: rhamnogalacturonan lyase [Dysgonomonas sp.]